MGSVWCLQLASSALAMFISYLIARDWFICLYTALRECEEVNFVTDLDLGEEGFIMWEVAHDEKRSQMAGNVPSFLSLFLALEDYRGH